MVYCWRITVLQLSDKKCAAGSTRKRLRPHASEKYSEQRGFDSSFPACYKKAMIFFFANQTKQWLDSSKGHITNECKLTDTS